MNTTSSMKTLRRKLHLHIIVAVVCALVFILVLYAERVSFLSSSSFFKLKSCPRKDVSKVKSTSDQTGDRKADQESIEELIDDRFDFDPEECNVANGKWVFNRSIKPLYSDRSCPYLDRQFSCVKNGRPDSDYLHWEWQPEDCTLPRFDAELALKKLRGKKLLFVGDSLQRGQWQSLVCMVEWIIPEKKKSIKRGRSHTIFKAIEYNATIEFYWAPYLVESNSDQPIIGDPSKRIIKVDSVAKHAKHWVGVDIIVFNTYVWWMSGLRIKSLWGAFANAEAGFEELDTHVAYNIALKTWANWVDTTINPNKTRAFFISMSPTHSRSEDWNRNDGLKCFNETKPVMKKNFWGTGSNKQLMSVVAKVVGKMHVPVSVINITQLSEYRIDGHASIYSEIGGKLLTDEEKADPKNHADCIHWCLPGVPDTWNQILFAHL